MEDGLAWFEKRVIQGKATWWNMFLPSGKVIFGSAKTEMLGYDEKDFKQYSHFTNLLHPDDYEATMQAMRDHMEGKKEYYETLYRIKCSDGTYIQFYDLGQIVKKEGEEVTIMGFVWKIEEGNIPTQMEEFKKSILHGNPAMIDLIKQMQ
jgi:two-component system CheB/CheR fusion protein